MSNPNIRVDLTLASDRGVGANGLTRASLTALEERVVASINQINARHLKGELGFLDLPLDRTASAQAVEMGQRIRAGFDDVVVLGIGGSSLGAKALIAALCHPQHNLRPATARQAPRIFFPDNSDPRTLHAILDVVDLKRTAFVAITKSGGTAETWAQLLVLSQKYGAGELASHVFAVTDPTIGALRNVATEQGWPVLNVPPNIGGRFSVLTAVGLLPAAAAGIDVDALLLGAREMAERCRVVSLTENPAASLAAALYLFDATMGRPIHVFMPYADCLRETSDWFVQLWAESLGKKRRGEPVGPTPLRAVGATDQHSLLQLLMEGPNNKVTVFVAAEASPVDARIPPSPFAHKDVVYLGGHSMFELLSAEQRATAAGLARAGRPSITLRMPAIDARCMGQLLMLLEGATAIAGGLYGTDAFDQPGVELGKRLLCGLLGRPGYEASRVEFESVPSSLAEWVI